MSHQGVILRQNVIGLDNDAQNSCYMFRIPLSIKRNEGSDTIVVENEGEKNTRRGVELWFHFLLLKLKSLIRS